MSFSAPLTLGIPTALAFIIYGVTCLCTPTMRVEFERFQVPQYRILIGITQLMGAGALLVGMRVPVVGLIGALGLTVQMAAGVAVRVRIGDTWLQASQAAVFMFLNAWLVVSYWKLL